MASALNRSSGPERNPFIVTEAGLTPDRKPGLFREVPLPMSVAIDTSPLQCAPERFIPRGLRFASEKARALTYLQPSISIDLAHALTAMVYGFSDWLALEAAYDQARPLGRYVSPVDEDIDRERQRLRRQWQVRVLQVAAGLSRTAAVGLQLDWKPTSRQFDYTQPLRPISVSIDTRICRFSGTITLASVARRGNKKLKAQRRSRSKGSDIDTPSAASGR